MAGFEWIYLALMPISKKIQDQIESLQVTQKEKALMLQILSKEDSGLKNYQKEYEQLVDKFILQSSEGGEELE